MHRRPPNIKAISEDDFKRASEMTSFTDEFKSVQSEIDEIRKLVAESKRLPEVKLHRAISLLFSVALHVYYTPFSVGFKGLIAGLNALSDCLPKDHKVGNAIREFTTCFELSQTGGASRYFVSSSLAFLVIKMETLLGQKFPDSVRARFVMLGTTTYELMQNPISVQKSASDDHVQCEAHDISVFGLEARSIRCERNGASYYEFQLVSPDHGVVCRYTEKTTLKGPLKLPGTGGAAAENTEVESLLYVKPGFDFSTFLSDSKTKASGFLSTVLGRISACLPSAALSSGMMLYAGARFASPVVALWGLGLGVMGLAQETYPAKPTATSKTTKKTPSSNYLEQHRRQFWSDFQLYMDHYNQGEYSKDPFKVVRYPGRVSSASPEIMIYAESHKHHDRAHLLVKILEECLPGELPHSLKLESGEIVSQYQGFFKNGKKDVAVSCWYDSAVKQHYSRCYDRMKADINRFYQYCSKMKFKDLEEKLRPFLDLKDGQMEAYFAAMASVKHSPSLRGLSGAQFSEFSAIYNQIIASSEQVTVAYNAAASAKGVAERDKSLLPHLLSDVKNKAKGMAMYVMGGMHSLAAIKYLKTLGIPFAVVYSSADVHRRVMASAPPEDESDQQDDELLQHSEL